MAQSKETPQYHGHRKRLKSKFLGQDIRSFEDYEILELLLCYAIPRADTKSLAKALLRKYGSLAAVVNGEQSDLQEFKGLGESSIILLKALLDFNSRLMIEREPKKIDILNNWASVLNYCKLTMGYKKQEYFRVLYLNRKNHLLADELHTGGTVDRIQVYPREIAKRAIHHAASAVILVHNHPSLDVNPSTEDIEMTKTICKAIEPIGCVVHDHLIISNNNHFSFRASNLI
ncbi:MAG: RadC family protein [Alphaproteobacteria bacterium]